MSLTKSLERNQVVTHHYESQAVIAEMMEDAPEDSHGGAAASRAHDVRRRGARSASAARLRGLRLGRGRRERRRWAALGLRARVRRQRRRGP
jgi:hypothetical protein